MRIQLAQNHKADALVYIITPVESVKFASSAITIYLNEDADLAPIFNDGKTTPYDTSLTWTVTDGSVASVDSYGKVHAKQLGTSWVYATAYNGMRAEVQVRVVAGPQKIQLSAKNMTLWSGASKKITYNITPSYTTNKNVTWTSSDPSIAYYDGFSTLNYMIGEEGAWTTYDPDGVVSIQAAEHENSTKASEIRLGYSGKMKAVLNVEGASKWVDYVVEAVLAEVQAKAAEAEIDAKTAKEEAERAKAEALKAETAAVEAQKSLAQMQKLLNTLNTPQKVTINISKKKYTVKKGKKVKLKAKASDGSKLKYRSTNKKVAKVNATDAP